MVSITAQGGAKYPLTKCEEQAACCPIHPLVFFILTYTSHSITMCHPCMQEVVTTATKWHTSNLLPEHWKLSDVHVEDLEKGSPSTR